MVLLGHGGSVGRFPGAAQRKRLPLCLGGRRGPGCGGLWRYRPDYGPSCTAPGLCGDHLCRERPPCVRSSVLPASGLLILGSPRRSMALLSLPNGCAWPGPPTVASRPSWACRAPIEYTTIFEMAETPFGEVGALDVRAGLSSLPGISPKSCPRPRARGVIFPGPCVRASPYAVQYGAYSRLLL